MKFAEDYKVVLASSACDLADDPALTDSINMKGYHRCTYLIDIGTMAGGADTVMTVYSGAAAAAMTSVLTFKYAYGGAISLYGSYGANHDVLEAETSVATLTIVRGTYTNFMLQVEVDASAMDVANGENWLTLQFKDVGGATGLASVFAILEPRYTGNRSLSAVA